jgi:hypothetical protein
LSAASAVIYQGFNYGAGANFENDNYWHLRHPQAFGQAETGPEAVARKHIGKAERVGVLCQWP